jgi:hypothetical protein
MSAMQLFVTALGLVAGYWLVSTLLSRKDGAPPPPERQDRERDAPEPPVERSAMTPPWHHVLELSPDASVAEIQAAYEKLIAEDRAAAGRKAAEITAAYRQALQAKST